MILMADYPDKIEQVEGLIQDTLQAIKYAASKEELSTLMRKLHILKNVVTSYVQLAYENEKTL